MKYLSFLIILFSINSFSDDYKSANRLQEGDVISADVFNDILDRIELTLKTIKTSELVGTWDVTWKTCISGGPGNCSGLNVGSGWSSSIDNLFRTRSDTWTILDDGDETYSLSISNYCISGASGGQYYSDPCTGRISVDSGVMLFGTTSGAGVSNDSEHTEFYNIKRVSDSRFTLWQLKSGSNSFVSFQLDKKNLSPNPPTNFSATLQSGTTPNVTFSWTASEGGADSYTIKSKDSATGTFSDLQTGITNIGSFSDSLTSGTRWYRVFAVNSNGTSIGSNVVSVTK